MMMKLAKFIFSILVTKWIADAAVRAAHDPRVEKTVERWSSTILKKVLMTVLGAVFFSTGLVMTLMSAASRLDRGASIFGYRTGMALFIFLSGMALLAAATYKKPRNSNPALGEGRRTRPQLIDLLN